MHLSVKDEKCPLKILKKDKALFKYYSVPKTSKEGWTYYKAYGKNKNKKQTNKQTISPVFLNTHVELTFPQHAIIISPK